MLKFNKAKTIISKSKFTTGFTIVEVLVVIGIIAILTVIVFPSISNIRAKNRDAEKVADIAAIQLGLSLYKNQNGEYPKDIFNNSSFNPKYVTADSLISPNADSYVYIPLKKNDNKCIYYHLGVKLELPSAQIDTADNFTSEVDKISNGYNYCDTGYSGPGLATGTLQYNVHP